MNWDLLPLHIFPEGSLASSVITTVWVGVAVVAFFNLRFGWGLAGLVVPGYLVPLLLIKPWSVAVIFFEGVVTYLIVHAVSVVGARYLGLADFFGRDRFFALVLTSVIVRVVFDAFWLPGVGAWINQLFGLEFDYANNLHSFGLIIVALIANNFWKPGLLRGSFWLLIILAVTFLLVRFGLMEFTNFSVSNLNYLYEDVASSILASPKAYIILLTTAFIASRMNLHYAWEFNGILIPSLLALQWYQPTKLLLTFLEVGVILVAVHFVMKLPFFAHISLSGARKLFFFFTVAFVYKLLLGYGLEAFAPQLNVNDYFAFGYLISTLLALKIHDKDIGIRVTRATLQTSLVAVIMASFLGFALSFIPSSWEEADQKTRPQIAALNSEAMLDEVLLRQRMLDYSILAKDKQLQPSGTQLAQFQEALKSLQAYREKGEPALLQQASLKLLELDYELLRVEEHYLVLREAGEPRGWGIFVIDMRSHGGLVIEVPAAMEEQGAAEAALALFRDQEAAALAIHHLGDREGFANGIQVTRNPGSFFHQFHQVFGSGNSLQVRLMSSQGPHQLDSSGFPSLLLVKRKLPESLSLQSLERLMGKTQLLWDTPAIANVQRERTYSGFAELYLDPDYLHPLLAAPRVGEAPASLLSHAGVLSDYLLTRLDKLRETDKAFRPPQLEEMLYFDREVLKPLQALVMANGDWEAWPESSLNQLRYLDHLAQGLGYRITHFYDRFKAQNYLILENRQEILSAQPWSLLVIRVGKASSHFVQVPRPRFERNTLEVGVQLFQRLEAQALLIAGSHPYRDPEGDSNVLSPRSPYSLFNLIHQVWVRETGSAPLLVTQIRGRGQDAGTGAPSLLAFDEGLRLDGSPQLLEKELRQTLASLGLAPEKVVGQEATAGYEVGSSAQTAYLSAARNKGFALVWVAPEVRSAFEFAADHRQQQLQFRALNIETVRQPLTQAVKSYIWVEAQPPRDLLEHYIATQDIVALRILQQRGYKLIRVLDPEARQAFMLVFEKDRPQALLALVNLNPLDRKLVKLPSTPLPGVLERFIDTKTFMLISGDGR